MGGRQGADATPPVAFRSAGFGGRTYLYAVNDAPFYVMGFVGGVVLDSSEKADEAFPGADEPKVEA